MRCWSIRMEKRLPLLDRMYKEFPTGEAPAAMEELADLFRRADGFAIVSGEYNNGIPPALKNLLDHFLEEYFWRPAAIACYSGGRWGGVRGAMQLRMSLAEMGMVTIPCSCRGERRHGVQRRRYAVRSENGGVFGASSSTSSRGTWKRCGNGDKTGVPY